MQSKFYKKWLRIFQDNFIFFLNKCEKIKKGEVSKVQKNKGSQDNPRHTQQDTQSLTAVFLEVLRYHDKSLKAFVWVTKILIQSIILPTHIIFPKSPEKLTVPTNFLKLNSQNWSSTHEQNSRKFCPTDHTTFYSGRYTHTSLSL